MPGPEGVVWAFVHLGETADAASHTVLAEKFTASGEDFMGIGLVTYVKDNLVLGRIIYIMESHYEFHGPEA